ncbi:MAG: DUF3098 domain-containing protein [Paludibacteraceae bacterium]|nr:DUF3098 domain-containing protein [Paludibacteraceae bacterium]
MEKQHTNDKQPGFALAPVNLILIAICFVIIVIGFCLMLGPTTEQAFNPDIFSFRRITLGPMISLFGFVAMIGAILYKPRNKKQQDQ